MRFSVLSFLVLLLQLGVSAGCSHSRVMAIGGTVVDGDHNVVVGNTVPFTDHRRAVALNSPVADGVVPGADLTVPQVMGAVVSVISPAPALLGARSGYCWERDDLLVLDESPRVRNSCFLSMFYLHLKSIVAVDEGRVDLLVEVQEHLADFSGRCVLAPGNLCEPSFEGIGRSSICLLQDFEKTLKDSI